MTVWLVYGRTESGDDWSLIFKNQPTKEDILDGISNDNWLREEDEAGCIQGWDISENKVIENDTTI